MKARRLKEWDELSPGEKRRLEAYLLDILRDTEDKDMRIVLELLIKMFCMLMHDCFGYGEKRLTLLIGNLQMMFLEQRRLVSKGEQLEFLDGKMAKIFRRGGFPQSFIDGMLGEIDREALKERTEVKVDER